MRRPITVIHEPPHRGSAEGLHYTVDIYDANGNYVMLLAQLRHLKPAMAAYEAYLIEMRDETIFLRQGARVVRRSDRPEG